MSLEADVARLSDITPGFYGITVKETDDSQSFSGVNVVAFNDTDFYVTQNSSNTDESIVNFRPDDIANIGAGEGVLASKVGKEFQLKSLVAGTNVSLSSDADEITINATGGDVPPEFYGISVCQNTTTFTELVKLNFDSNFYITQHHQLHCRLFQVHLLRR